MAPGGDRLARLWFGNTVIDEVDYRQKAAACAWRDAGREFHAKRAEEQAPAPSSSHYSSGATNSGRTLQRRDTVGGRTGGGTVGARDTTRAGAGSSSQRLIVDPYGVGPAGAEGSQRRTGQQVRSSHQQPQSRSHRTTHQTGRSHGASVNDHHTRGHDSGASRGQRGSTRGHQGGGEIYHGHPTVEATPRSSRHG